MARLGSTLPSLQPRYQAAHCGRQQDGLHRASLLRRRIREDQEGNKWFHQEAFMPISGFYGDNLIKASTDVGW